MSQPNKYQVRKWLYKLLERKEPPPSPEEIRRNLGWSLLTVVPNRRGR